MHGRQLIEHPAAVDQPALGLDLANTRPFCRPRMVLRVRPLGQAVGVPLVIDVHLEYRRRVVRADGIDRVSDGGASGDGVELAGL